MQLQVHNSPFTEEQVKLLNPLLSSLSAAQQIWLSGYLTAVGTAAAPVALDASLTGGSVNAANPVQAGQPEEEREVTVLFGSQTGNSERIAQAAGKKLESRGFKVIVSSMRDFKPNSLKKVRNLLIVVSTHGDGEPPDNALSFYEFLHSKRAPRLEKLNYSVLALGDTSYEFFCQTGKDFDKILEALGGNRISPRVDCDLDFDEAAALWTEHVSEALDSRTSVPASGSTGALGASAGALNFASAVAVESSGYTRANPYRAEVIDNVNLNGRGSDRETRHLVLSLEDSGLEYEPGDCVGIYPQNHPELVDAMIAEWNWDPEEAVPVNKQGDLRPLKEALLNHYEITVLTKPLLEQIAPHSSHSGLKELLQPGQESSLRAYIEGRDLLDLVRDFAPWQGTASDIVAKLRKLPPRLYSIASSLKANPDEVHLTIRAVRYDAHGRDRYGVCSIQCAERVEPGDTLPIFIQHNPNFKLPSDPEQPIIMIGPGTGVAPFRAFMEEREELGVAGKSWLFFGDRRFVTDFLYQTEWQRWLKEGVLTRMNVAFSRDTAEKVYVQQRMLENSRELYAWLEEGATVYVCGDEKYMARDVHATLLTILEREGGLSPEKAAAYLTAMQDQKRYQRDVY